MARARRLVLLAILAALVGCASPMRDFARPAADTHKLGATTYAQVVQQMGEPDRSRDFFVAEGVKIRSISYGYGAAAGEPLEEGVIPVRAQTYFFHGDTLVGQQYVSTFKSDHTNFDETKRSALLEGRTARAEVIALLGRPAATFIPPLVKDTSGEALEYSYRTTRKHPFGGGLKFWRKALRITFDEDDRVKRVQYFPPDQK